MKYFLSLGSNLGDREKNISQALFLLEKGGVRILKVSSLYETQPVDFPSVPWFYNMVVEINADIDPKAFLALVKKIEKKMGRRQQTQKSPRIIDVDILLAEKTVIQMNELEIPHPRIHKRNFVLVPFVEISPDTIHPLFDEKIKNLKIKSDDCSTVKKIKGPLSPT